MFFIFVSISFFIAYIMLKIIAFMYTLYIKYRLNCLSDTAKIFKYVCISHVRLAIKRDIISLDEEREMIYAINKICSKYTKKLTFDVIIKSSKEKLKVERR
jgi:hypothetical protein